MTSHRLSVLAAAAAAVLVSACAPSQPSSPPETPAVVDIQWGPLAAFRSPLQMDARNEGTLAITERCTFLERDGERELLAWPAERTSWDAATGSIAFLARSGEVVQLRTGDRVVLGGGGSSAGEDGLDGAQWAARLTWVARPAPECLIDRRWEVSDVQPPFSALPPEAGIDCGPIVDRGLCRAAAELAASVRLNPPPVVDARIRLPVLGRDSCTTWANPCGERSVIVTIQSGDTLQDFALVLMGTSWVVLEPGPGERP